MIDLAALRQDPDAVKQSQAARGESVELVDQVIAADAARFLIKMKNMAQNFGY